MIHDYNTFQHFPYYKPVFGHILQYYPEVKEALDRAQNLIDNSIFKGKTSLDMCIYKGKVWFIAIINNTYSCNNFVYAYSGLWVRLAREIEGMKVQIKK